MILEVVAERANLARRMGARGVYIGPATEGDIYSREATSTNVILDEFHLFSASVATNLLIFLGWVAYRMSRLSLLIYLLAT